MQNLNKPLKECKKMLQFGKFKFELCQNVTEPNFPSYYLASQLDHFKGEKALDLGTGCGFFAIVLSENFEKVYAVDVTNDAIKCTNNNSKLNAVDSKIQSVRGNLFEPVKGMKFDLIVSNPPQMPTPPSNERDNWIGYMDNSGVDGRNVIDEIIENASNFLTPHGKLLIVHLDVADIEKTVSRLQKSLRTNIFLERRIPVGRLAFERKYHIKRLGISFVESNNQLFQRVCIIESEKL